MTNRKPGPQRGRKGQTKQGERSFSGRGKQSTGPQKAAPSRGGGGNDGRRKNALSFGGQPARREGQPAGRFQKADNRPTRGRNNARPANTGNDLAYVERGREDRSAPAANRRFGPNARPAPRPQYQPLPHQALRMEGQLDSSYQQEPENLLSGRNPIREALKVNRDIEKLLVATGDLSGSAREIVSMARKAGVIVQEVERARLDQITRNHQGMVAFASAYSYSTVDEMLALAKERKEPPFLILLDKVTDPQNLGAIIRTAACVGAHGVVVPLHRAVGLTPSAVRASAGAVEHVKVARVVNLNQLIKQLKRQGVWIYGADAQGTDLRRIDFDGACAMVIGSEGEGISEHTLTLCDHRVSIPMTGVIDSLNASVAAGVLMYAAYMGRKV